ncbi:MAG TPA: hypothetical protein VML55_10035 [Planctomycetaceae bacterium]|nr:hypothetical protein [Planctomycetaceae bacterium]
MAGTNARSRGVWLAVGVVAGLALAWVWPHEPLAARATDRDARFAMTTIPVRDITISGFRDNLDGVFVLDFLTGRLTGAVLNNKTGQFFHFYGRNVAADFNVDPNAGNPAYAIVTGNTGLSSQRGVTFANGTIYIGEMNSGLVIAYAFPYVDSNRPLPPTELVKVAAFPFREPQ